MREKTPISINFLLLFILIAFCSIKPTHAICGDSIIDVGESCDTSGLYASGTCCSSNCTSLPGARPYVYYPITCTTNAECDDNDPCTTDACDSTTFRCKRAPVSNCEPCVSAADCKGLPCRTFSACSGGFCSYANLPSNGAFQARYLQNHCVYEDACRFNSSCFFQFAGPDFPTGELFLTNVAIPQVITPSPSCYTTYYFSDLFRFVQNSTVSARHGPVDYVITNVTYNAAASSNCKFTSYITLTDPKNGTILWARPYIRGSSLPSSCALTVQGYYSNCNNTQFSFTLTFTLPDYLIFGDRCSAPTLCNDNSTATTDSCPDGFRCRYRPSTSASYPCDISSDCRYFPCYTQTCTGNNGFCNYNPITSSNVPGPRAGSGSACTELTKCRYNYICSSGAVGYTMPSAWTGSTVTNFYTDTYMQSIIIRCNSTVPFSIFGAPDYSTLTFGPLGHPGFRYFIYPNNNPSMGPQNYTVTNNDSTDPIITFSGGVTSSNYDTNPSRGYGSQIVFCWRTDCPDSTYDSLFATNTRCASIFVYFSCCGDGTVDSSYGEQCDIRFGGPALDVFNETNGLAGSCCTTSCQLDTSHKLCSSTDPNTCRSPSYCDDPSMVNGRCPVVYYGTDHVCAVSTAICTKNATCTATLDHACGTTSVAAGTACNTDNSLCTIESCTANATCALQSTISYDDGQYCNGIELCDPLTGLMIPGTPINCTSTDSCFTGSCSELTQSCIYTPVPNSTGACGVSNVGACRYGNYSCIGTGPTPVIACVGNINPSPELCLPGGVDENCNGVIDENCNTTLCAIDADCSVVVVGTCQIATCDTVNHVCVVNNKTNGSPCNDGLACTTGDTCTNGLCNGTPVICNDDNPCTQDTCVEPAGTCLFDGAPMLGFPCNADSNNCTQNDSCNNQGQCIPGTTLTCNSTGNPCTTNLCNITTGTCYTVNVLGTCNDNLACTTNEQCFNGDCVGAQIDCDDHLICTLDYCVEPSGSCVHDIIGGTCLIGGVCYTDGQFNPSNPCLICNASMSDFAWSFVSQTNISCNDGDPCSVNDVCRPDLQMCLGTPKDCSSFSNQCNTGVCQPANGQCIAQPVTDGTTCTDGLFCTDGDICVSGSCSPGPTRDCHYLDSQCTVGACNETLDMCVAQPLLDFTPCQLDTLVCNGNEHCLSGVCINGVPPSCPANTSCSYYQCVEPTGCTQFFRSGLPCDNGDVCNFPDTCAVGQDICLAGPSTLNCDDNNDCTNDFCDHILGCQNVPISGCQNCTVDADCAFQVCHSVVCTLHQCVYTHLPDGSSCSNGNICDGVETCLTGTCLNPPDLNCTSSNPCVTTGCDTISGCYEIPNASLPFNDNNVCTINDRCSTNGTGISDPFPCPAPTTCLSYTCIDQGGVPTCDPVAINVGGSCSTGDPCITGATCNSFGQCVGTPVTCPAPNQCQISITCVGGSCVTVNKPNGTACQTGNLCTSDYCNGLGTCLEGPPIVTCAALDQCHSIGTCNPSTGMCDDPALPDNTPCDDGNNCTQTDICLSAQCTGTDPVHCPAIDQCHAVGVCQAPSGICTTPLLPNFSPCTLPDLCVFSAICLTGNCTPTGYIDCSNPNPCITTGCNPLTGCTQAFNTNPCDDNNLCNTGTTCVTGTCASGTGTPVNCDDNDPCTLDICLPNSGCFHSPISNCQACSTSSDCLPMPCNTAVCYPNNTCGYYVNDTNTLGCLNSQFCDGIEFCLDGGCHNGLAPDCTDTNPCTIDTCDYNLNTCVHTPNVNQSCVSPNLCSLSASCDINGACVPNVLIPCTPATQCQVLLGCNPLLGACEYMDMVDGTPCNDTNACTGTDECMLGICTGSNHVVCTPLDPCHLAGTCIPSTGQCTNPIAPNGTPCDDGLFCTPSSSCVNGDCVTFDTPSCPLPEVYDPQCQYVDCDENTDSCSIVNFPDGFTCVFPAPVGPCSGTDSCQQGACVRSYANNTVCRAADSSGCDLPEYCSYGFDSCPADGKVTDGTSCPSALYCSFNQCNSGVCQLSSLRDCSYLNTNCKTGFCDENLDSCIHVNRPDGTICNANITGECIESNACSSGLCGPVFSPPNQICNNGSLCTVNDHCSGNSNTCLRGANVDCTAFDSQCTVGACDPGSGSCYAVPLADGTSCNADSYPCTAGDHCRNSTCVPGDPLDCTYLDSPCTYGYCQIVNLTYAACGQQFNSSDCFFSNCTGGCSYGHSHWAKNTQAWPNITESTVLCGMEWSYWLNHPHLTHYLWAETAEEYIGAKINLYNGACQPPVLTGILLDTLSLLMTCDLAVNHQSVNAHHYRDVKAKLQAYNNGTYGPGHCDDDGVPGGDNFMRHFNNLDYLLLIGFTTVLSFIISFVAMGCVYRRGYNILRIFRSERSRFEYLNLKAN